MINSDLLAQVSENAKRILARQERTPQQLARDAGIPAAALTRLLAGKGFPGVVPMVRVAFVLNVRVEDFFDGCNF